MASAPARVSAACPVAVTGTSSVLVTVNAPVRSNAVEPDVYVQSLKWDVSTESVPATGSRRTSVGRIHQPLGSWYTTTRSSTEIPDGTANVSVTGVANVVPSGPRRHAGPVPGAVRVIGWIVNAVAAAMAPGGTVTESAPSPDDRVPPATPTVADCGAPTTSPRGEGEGTWAPPGSEGGGAGGAFAAGAHAAATAITIARRAISLERATI